LAEVGSKWVDHELRLQLERLESTSSSWLPSPPLALAALAQLQLQLDRAKPALSEPVAVLQLDRLQLDRV
jgi:hypothetical protein